MVSFVVDERHDPGPLFQMCSPQSWSDHVHMCLHPQERKGCRQVQSWLKVLFLTIELPAHRMVLTHDETISFLAVNGCASCLSPNPC
jgi:hypothetical protein